MKRSFKAFVGAAAVASIVAAAGIASAQTAAEVTCVAAIQKNIAKYQATLAKNLAGCHKSRIGGKIGAGTLCNTAGGADLKGGRVSSVPAIKTAINTACTPAGLGLIASQFPRCPSPVATSDDATGTTGIDDYNELAQCLIDLSEAYVNRLGETALGNPDMTALAANALVEGNHNKSVIKCQGAIGKGIAGVIKAASGARGKCQVTRVKGLLGLDYSDANCGGPGDGGKVSGAVTKMNDAITKACTLDPVPPTLKAELDMLGACADDAAGLKRCAVTRAVAPTADGLAAAMFEFPNDGAGNLTCAATADITINAAYGKKLTNSRLDSGYTGLAHNVDVVDESLGGVKIQNCNADCENCEVRIDPSNGYCRCGNDSTIKCDTVNGADFDQCGGNTCHCMFGPPLPLSSGSTPVCVVNRFSQDFTGGTTVMGSYDVVTRTRALVHTGTDQLKPCPTCEDDETLNDNVKGGNCAGETPRAGLTCDANAWHPDFGYTSFDCLPDLGANVTGGGLNLALEFTDGEVGFTAGIPTGAFCSSGTCHCSHCTGDSTVACSSNLDCSEVGAGTCGSLGPPAGAPAAQNSCTGGPANCVADANNPDMGKCSTGVVSYCTGALRKNGNGILTCSASTYCQYGSNNDTPCSTDAECTGGGICADECASMNSMCEGEDCGTCEKQETRSCFLPLVTATGTPGIFSSEGVSAFCSGSTSNTGVNDTGGLPGPGRVKLSFDFDIKCGDVDKEQYELPGGSNCD